MPTLYRCEKPIPPPPPHKPKPQPPPKKPSPPKKKKLKHLDFYDGIDDEIKSAIINRDNDIDLKIKRFSKFLGLY